MSAATNNGSASALPHPDAAILDAWERRAQAYAAYNDLPHSEINGEPYTPEEAEQWVIIDATEDVIQTTVATSPEGVAIQLWTTLAASASRDDEQAASRRDLDYFEAHANLDWTERLVVAAIRSIEAMRAQNEIASLWVARAWLERWEALGGAVGITFDNEGQPNGVVRGMIADADDWKMPDADRDDVPPVAKLIVKDWHMGAVKGLESLLEMCPSLKEGVREIAGRRAMQRWAESKEA